MEKKIKCIHTPTSCTGKLLWVKYLMFLFLSHHSSSSHNLCNLYPKYKSKGILGCSNYWWYKYQALLLYCGVTKKNMLLKLKYNRHVILEILLQITFILHAVCIFFIKININFEPTPTPPPPPWGLRHWWCYCYTNL